MFAGVFLDDADDFLSNSAKYIALQGLKVKKTSKLANLSQILAVFGLKTPLRTRPMHGDIFSIGSHGPAYFPPILVTKKSALEKMGFFKANCKI